VQVNQPIHPNANVISVLPIESNTGMFYACGSQTQKIRILCA